MKPQSPEAVVRKYQSKGVLIDTNLLLLYLIGSVSLELISICKITASLGFTVQDYEVLCSLLTRFKKVVTTPHILTEVSNHSDKLKGDKFYVLCDRIRDFVNGAEEINVKSSVLCSKNEFPRFGLCDMAIGEIAPGNYLILTVDFELAGYLQKRKVDLINFNHVRQINWSE